MKKFLIRLVILLVLFNCSSALVFASSGRLRSGSIKTCNGILYGQHGSDNHYHRAEKKGGYYYPVGDAIYSNPCSGNSNPSGSNNSSNSNVNKKPVTNNASSTNVKSSDNTLKSITIDNQEVKVQDNISFTTNKETVSIKVVPDHNKATYKINNKDTLDIGVNNVSVVVTAEDGKTKNYNIQITREEILSSNVGLKVTINEKELEFNDYKSYIEVEDKFDLKYYLEDDKSSIKYDNIEDLKIGNNIIKFEVIAEDGTSQVYEVNVYKIEKTTSDEPISNVKEDQVNQEVNNDDTSDTTDAILGFAICCGVGIGIYKFKKRK